MPNANPLLAHDALDASNRVLGLLAGATGQSFNQIGYGFVPEGGTLFVHGSEGNYSNLDKTSFKEGTLDSSVLYALAISGKGLEDLSANPLGFASVLEGTAPNTLDRNSPFDVSPFQADMDDQLIFAGSAQSPASFDGLDAALGGPLEGLTLVDTPSVFFSDLNGEKQAAFREFLDTVGGDLDGAARDFFQSNVQGRVKAITGEAIDSLGVDALDPLVDPVQAFDYYGTSADLIQNTRSALSLSSIALPQVGPTVAMARDELFQRLDA